MQTLQTKADPYKMSTCAPWTIAGIRREFDAGGSVVALVEQCLDRIARTNDETRAMIFVAARDALEDARQLEDELRSGAGRGPLHGVPVAVKDVIDVRGWPTTAGSKLFEGRAVSADAPCVANLRAAGAIIIGKTNLHELTAGNHDNPWFGKVVNPLDRARGTGGTSSGSAAAVASGYCVVALGTDTGGSNRSTAAATGLVGLKPTNGLVDANGTRPTAPTFDTIGPIAVSVEDARLVHYAMLGKPVPVSEPTRLSGLRIGLCPDLYFSDVDPAVAEAHERLMTLLAGEGASVLTLRFPLAKQVRDAGLTILTYEFAREYRALAEARPDLVGNAVLDFIAEGSKVAEADYRMALALREQATRAFQELLISVDVLAAPVAPGLAPRLADEITTVGSDLVAYGPAGGSFRRWANVFGVPALAIPLPRETGMPASIQILTPHRTEDRLFSIGEALSRLVRGD